MKKPRYTRKFPYKEGTWFAIPLRQAGYAIGRVARHSPAGKIVLVYLFGPKREQIPTLQELDDLEPHDAVKVVPAGDLGLLDGTWQVIGESPLWERERWPIPAFIRKDDLSETAWRVVYSDDDPNRVLCEQRIPYETTGLEDDGFYGFEAVEDMMSELLEA